jgi:hypothetical protein
MARGASRGGAEAGVAVVRELEEPGFMPG